MKENIKGIALSIGYRAEKIYRMPMIIAKENGGVLPFFCPQAQSRFGGVQIKGSIGLMVSEFENEWEVILKAHDRKGHKFVNTSWFGMYITNFSQFSDPPVFSKDDVLYDRDGRVARWITDIMDLTELLPKNINDLEGMFKSGHVLGEDVSSFISNSVKLQFFSKWSAARGLKYTSKITDLGEVGDPYPYGEILRNSTS